MAKRKMQLNNEQAAAVDLMEGVAVIVAAAGSGKTTVIERRAENLISSGTPPTAVLILSHTVKAANEIRLRLHERLRGAKEVQVGTIHSLCYSILRQYPIEAGLSRNFTVATPASLREMAKEIRRAMMRDKYARIPKAERLLAAVSFSRNTGCSLSEVSTPV